MFEADLIGIAAGPVEDECTRVSFGVNLDRWYDPGNRFASAIPGLVGVPV
ncbi:hypothetical protein ACPPVO_42915 [Dactylosporangium sp. McL0621]